MKTRINENTKITLTVGQLKKLVKESLNASGIPDESWEKIKTALKNSPNHFYKSLVGRINGRYYKGDALDFLERWFDNSSISNNWEGEYPWYKDEKNDLWGDGVMLGGELKDVDRESYSASDEPDKIGRLYKKYVDHADTDFWKFLYDNIGAEDLDWWLDAINAKTISSGPTRSYIFKRI